MEFKSLATTPLEEILDAHNDAFSDYSQPMQLTLERFKSINIQRGVSYPLSIGAFNDQKLVGFILNSVRDWDGKLTAYDCGTGVRVDYRKQKIGKTMFKELIPLLKKENVHQYLLEVIKSNEPALELYKNQGFQIKRSFTCMAIEAVQLEKSLDLINKAKICDIRQEHTVDFNLIQDFWDFDPSWQNSNDSVLAVQSDFVYINAYLDEKLVGYVIINPKNGGIAHFGVDPAQRRKGIATNLLSSIVRDLDIKGIHLINIDEKSESTIEFLKHYGFEVFTEQYEMVLSL